MQIGTAVNCVATTEPTDLQWTDKVTVTQTALLKLRGSHNKLIRYGQKDKLCRRQERLRAVGTQERMGLEVVSMLYIRI